MQIFHCFLLYFNREYFDQYNFCFAVNFFCFYTGNTCFARMDVDAVVYYFIWLSMKLLNMTSSEKHSQIRSLICQSLLPSVPWEFLQVLEKKKNSVTHSLFTMQSSLFSLNLSLFPLFVLGKHFIFILHLAFSQYESFAESVVGFNFIIGFWFSYNVSYVIFLDFFVSSDLYLHVSILLPLRNHNDLSPFHHYLPLSFLNLFMIFKHIICSRMLFLMSSR